MAGAGDGDKRGSRRDGRHRRGFLGRRQRVLVAHDDADRAAEGRQALRRSPAGSASGRQRSRYRGRWRRPSGCRSGSARPGAARGMSARPASAASRRPPRPGPSRSSRSSIAARDARAASESAAVRVSASSRPLTRSGHRAQQGERRVAAHRASAHGRAPDAHRVEQRRDIVGIVFEARISPVEPVLIRARFAEPPEVRRDRRPVLGQRPQLRHPHPCVQRKRVQEDDGVPGRERSPRRGSRACGCRWRDVSARCGCAWADHTSGLGTSAFAGWFSTRLRRDKRDSGFGIRDSGGYRSSSWPSLHGYQKSISLIAT